MSVFKLSNGEEEEIDGRQNQLILNALANASGSLYSANKERVKTIKKGPLQADITPSHTNLVSNSTKKKTAVSYRFVKDFNEDELAEEVFDDYQSYINIYSRSYHKHNIENMPEYKHKCIKTQNDLDDEEDMRRGIYSLHKSRYRLTNGDDVSRTDNILHGYMNKFKHIFDILNELKPVIGISVDDVRRIMKWEFVYENIIYTLSLGSDYGFGMLQLFDKVYNSEMNGFFKAYKFIPPEPYRESLDMPLPLMKSYDYEEMNNLIQYMTKLLGTKQTKK